MAAKKEERKKEKREKGKEDRMLIRSDLIIFNLIFCAPERTGENKGIVDAIHPSTLFLCYGCTMITTLCIEDQDGDRMVYHRGTHVPFRSLFVEYISVKGIQPIGGLFLSHGRRIRYDDTPKSLGFDTEHHVIIFVNLLTFFDQGELEYQVEYPLTGGNKSEGVLDEDTLTDVIDALIGRGHIVKIVPEGDEAAPPLHKCYRVQQDQERDFYHWNLYTAHHDRGMVYGDHSKTEVLFEIKTIRQSGKAAKNRLMRNRE
jgi:hypothetical protein